MIITKLFLINFGKFTNREIHFNSNINIIFGLNEAGKTTIVDAIAGVLYGFGGRRDDVKKLRARYAPKLNAAVYKAGLSTVINNIGEIYIERDFLTNKAEVFTLQGDSRSFSGFTVHDVVNESLGIRNIHLFRSTMLIRQEEIALLAGAEVTDLLTRKIIAGDQTASIKSIFRTLGQKYLELNKGLIRKVGNPGPIRQCQDEINRLTGQLESIENLDTEYSAMITKAEILEKSIFDLQTRLQALEATISAYRKKKELTQQCNNLRERQQIIMAKIRSIKQAYAELAEIDSYLATKEPFRDLISEAVLNQISNLEKNIERLQERETLSKQQWEYYSGLTEKLQSELQSEKAGINYPADSQTYTLAQLMEAERLTGQLSELNRQLNLKQTINSTQPNTNRKSKSPLILGAGFLLSLGTAAVPILTPGQWGIWPMLLLAIGMGLLVAGFMLSKNNVSREETGSIGHSTSEALASCRQKISGIVGDLDLDTFRKKVYAFEETRKKIYSLENQLAGFDLQKYREEADQARMEMQQCTLKMKNLLEQSGTFSPKGYRELYDNYWEARRKRANMEHDAAKLSDGENETGLSEELSEIAVRLVNLQAEITLIPANIIEEQFTQLVQEQAAKKEQLTTAHIDLAKVHTAISDFECYALNNHDRWDLENSIMEKKAELESLKLKKNGIAEAARILRDSWREVQSGIMPLVGERASGIISAITDKKYTNIEPDIKETEFSFAATAEGIIDKTSPDFLSAGTRDQVYLSVRLAIAEFLAEGKRFPLILDDPFINFDQVRLKNTVDLLEQIAGNHQVILLTKDPSFPGAIISLDKF